MEQALKEEAFYCYRKGLPVWVSQSLDGEKVRMPDNINRNVGWFMEHSKLYAKGWESTVFYWTE